MIAVVVTFLALLALIALTGAVLLAITGRKPGVIELVGPQATNLAWLIATVSTVGSLFLSEVAGFVPCLLCWIQRGFMYPLAILLAIPAVRRTRLTWLPAWTLSGALVGLYHYLEQHLPALSSSDFCDPAMPCSTIWVDEFGFVTIPFMAMSGFLAITALLLVHRRWIDQAALAARELEKVDTP
jgi:disulfide bond formation protein DsbB